jgi:hypothetical protein
MEPKYYNELPHRHTFNIVSNIELVQLTHSSH